MGVCPEVVSGREKFEQTKSTVPVEDGQSCPLTRASAGGFTCSGRSFVVTGITNAGTTLRLEGGGIESGALGFDDNQEQKNRWPATGRQPNDDGTGDAGPGGRRPP